MEKGHEADAVLAFLFDAELIVSERENEMAVREEEEAVKVEGSGGGEEVEFGKRMLLLKLDCEEVVSAWDEHGCPWMNETRPEFDPLGDDWPQILGVEEPNHGYGTREDENGGRSVGGVRVVSDERLARVARYREKRRCRLISKKIRYEVRRLNAEKRPRMKGRFCKTVQSYVWPQGLV